MTERASETAAGAGLRAVALWQPRIRQTERPDGTIIVEQQDPLGDYPARMNDRLVHWAGAAPDRPWIADREGEGWRTVTYAQALATVRAVGQALLDLDLGPERPVMILSGNGIEHALIALSAQHVGVPSAALAPAYSLVSTDHSKLRDIVGQITPGLVFAEDGAAFAPAILNAIPADVPVVTVTGTVEGRETRLFSDLAATEPTDAVDAAFAATGPDTVAKFMFTSGTTGTPKAVAQTQRVMCANQAMVLDCYRFLADEPPVVVDWAPWNHVAAGTKVFNLALYNGGTYHIDRGKPGPGAIDETIRNLREVSPTWYFNVPAGFELLVTAMERDDGLRQSFYKRLRMIMYSGAGMAAHTWEALRSLSEQTIGARVLVTSALGSTETGPFALQCTEEQDEPGNVGVPARGVILKLVPSDDKLEARIKSPSVTPGYWRSPELTEAAFDEEGFYRLGDALRYAVPGDASKGFYFDGRMAENFKLRTGTWVAVGPLRAQLIDQFGGLIRDAVVAGENREALGAILIPFYPEIRALVPGGDAMSDEDLLAAPELRQALEARLSAHAKAATGSSTRVVHAVLIDTPPEFDKGEVTDKGSINQRAVLRNRQALVEALYSDDPRVMHARKDRAA